MSFAFETNGFSKSFGRVQAIDALDLHVKPGEIYGSLALNVADMTSTIRALFGIIRSTSGLAQVLGQASRPERRRP
jgi:ABC-2 type transport system ATP-binding protein